MNPHEILFLIAAAILFLIFQVGPQSARSRGREGEARVSAGLRRFLDDSVYRLIEDVTLPVGDGTTQIDHLVLSPYGIFVIETKNMTGWIFGGASWEYWTQVIYRFRAKFLNPLRQNEVHVRAVQGLLRLEPDHLFGVIVFVGSAKFRTPMPPEVVRGVPALADFIASKRTAVFADYELPQLVDRLSQLRLEPGSRTDRAHIRNIERRNSIRDADPSRCPRCGGRMVERTNRRSGDRFLGCPRYPRCRGTRPIS